MDLDINHQNLLILQKERQSDIRWLQTAEHITSYKAVLPNKQANTQTNEQKLQ